MSTVTAVAPAGEGYVRVDLDFSDVSTARYAYLYRVVAGVQTVVRDCGPALLSGGKAVIYDTESPLDVSVTYRAVAPLNKSFSFEFEDSLDDWTDTTGAQGTIGTVAISKEFYYAPEGVASMSLVGTGATATVRAVSSVFPATAATSYTVQAKIMTPTYWTGGIGVQIFWFNAGVFLSSSGTFSNLTPAVGEFETYSLTATAPATTTQARIVVGQQGTPPNTQILYVDEAFALTAATDITTAAVVVQSEGGGWWTDPLHPATMARLQWDLTVTTCRSIGVVYLGVGAESFPADNALLEINNAPSAVATWNLRKSGRQAINVGAFSDVEVQLLRDLHASGAPLHLRLASRWGERDSYGLHGEVQFTRLASDQQVPWRLASSSFAKVDVSVGPAEGVLGTRYMDLDKYATFTAASGAGATWLDAMRGLVSTK